MARIRKAGKPAVLAINKAEGREPLQLGAAFYELGLGEPVAISALQGDRLALLATRILAELPAADAAAGDVAATPAPLPAPASPSSAGPTWASPRSSTATWAKSGC